MLFWRCHDGWDFGTRYGFPSPRFWSALFGQQVDKTAPLQFQKRSQLFIRAHDETLFVAVRVNNPDRPVTPARSS
jgi:hypothetical protein